MGTLQTRACCKTQHSLRGVLSRHWHVFGAIWTGWCPVEESWRMHRMWWEHLCVFWVWPMIWGERDAIRGLPVVAKTVVKFNWDISRMQGCCACDMSCTHSGCDPCITAVYHAAWLYWYSAWVEALQLKVPWEGACVSPSKQIGMYMLN